MLVEVVPLVSGIGVVEPKAPVGTPTVPSREPPFPIGIPGRDAGTLPNAG
jgi:hypothetical protein